MVSCQTVTVAPQGNMVAVSITAANTAPATISGTVKWKNIGNAAVMFQPKITVDATTYDLVLTPYSVSPGATVAIDYSVDNLSAATYSVCPVPN